MTAEKTKEEILKEYLSEAKLFGKSYMVVANGNALKCMQIYSQQQNAALIAENKALQDIINTQDELLKLYRDGKI